MARELSTFLGGASPKKGIDQAVQQVNRTYLHELGSDLAPDPIEDEFIVPARKSPTTVKIRSEVISQGAKQFLSPTYMASMRRRNADTVAKMIFDLQGHEDSTDFAVYTFPIYTKIKEMLELLQPARQEGNSRLILRMLRDTLMNGLWDRYRVPDVRSKVVALVEKRLIVDEVTMNSADAVFDELCDLGLDPVGADLPLADQGDEQEKIKVSD